MNGSAAPAAGLAFGLNARFVMVSHGSGDVGIGGSDCISISLGNLIRSRLVNEG